MRTITFVEHNNRHIVELEEETTLMQIAVNNAIPGIDGDCGGECACGTCHMMLPEDWFDKTGTITDTEEQMLSMTPERAKTSRLGCQIIATDAMDGMTVRLPEFQM